MAQESPGVVTSPPAKKKRGCGCFGCLVPLLVIVVLIAAALYFLVLQAAASVSIPAQLQVITPAASVTHGGSAQPASPGQLLAAGDQVRNDANGRSLIQFQDGSIIRLAQNAQVTLNSADFDKDGHLSNVSVSQQAGRTMTTVEKLVGGGAKFTIHGHSASASVRGTKFELIQNPDGSVRLKTYIGLVRFGGKNSVDVGPGKQSDANPGGTVSAAVNFTPDPADPFDLWLSSEEAAKAAGQPATAQTTFSAAALASGQTAAQPDYQTAGGEVVGELAFPGSAMTLSITDPSGRVFESSAARPGKAGKLVVVDIPNAPGGAFKVRVRGDNVNPSENFTVTMVTKFACAASQVVQGGVIRNVLSANDTRNALVQAGASNVSVRFSGASAGGANIGASGNFSGTSVAAGAIVYAAGGGNIGIAITAAQVNGFSIKQQITSAISSAGGRNLDSLNLGYNVDRVYSCSSGKDSFLVIEGHPPGNS